jgi:hypothetical protein
MVCGIALEGDPELALGAEDLLAARASDHRDLPLEEALRLGKIGCGIDLHGSDETGGALIHDFLPLTALWGSVHSCNIDRIAAIITAAEILNYAQNSRTPS